MVEPKPQNPIGLTEAESRLRLKQYGPNELPGPHWARRVLSDLGFLLDPMGLMLLVLSGVYALMGETHESVILLVAYVPIVGVDAALQYSSKRALEALRRSIQISSVVLRDGIPTSILNRDLVPGDVVVLKEGQVIPADGLILECADLTLDESSLTGESEPIGKKTADLIWSGSTVLAGSGLVEVQKTGASSQVGRLAESLGEMISKPSPLLQKINRLVSFVFAGALVLSAVVFVMGIYRGNGAGQSLITALTLAMAAVPEEFPIVFTLYLSLAAYRLANSGVLVKTLPSVETLGGVDVICTDKTGTLTEGKFQLVEVQDHARLDPKTLAQLLVFSCESKVVDAMEISILSSLEKTEGLAFAEKIKSEWELEIDYPFDLKDKYMCHIWRNKGTGEQVLSMKGSVEGVLGRCLVDEVQRLKILSATAEAASRGIRLLGLAYKRGQFTGQRSHDERDLEFAGLLCFSDPIRASAKAAVQICYQQGIQVKMLTGDHLLTAHAVADAIGLEHSHDLLFTGEDIERLAVPDRESAYRRGSIFARLRPEQKLAMVKALQEQGMVVAMTGDGVNDAPALKLADIGVSMGEGATDVARATAKMILMKSDFNGIVTAISEGKKVMQSLRESFGYLVAFHIPIVVIAMIQAFFLSEPLLLPIHIVLLELIVHPVSALVFAGLPLDRDHRNAQTLLSRSALFVSVARGVVLTALAILGAYLFEQSTLILVLITGSAGLVLGEAGGWHRAFKTRFWRNLASTSTLILIAILLSASELLSALFKIESVSVTAFLFAGFCGLSVGFPDRKILFFQGRWGQKNSLSGFQH